MNGIIMILVAMFCCLLWGSAFPCIKIGYKLFDIPAGDMWSQILFAGIRFAIAGVMVITFSSIGRKKFIKPAQPKRIITLSLSQTIVQYMFFYVGLAHTTGVKSSIITGIGTFLTLLVACLIFKQEKLTSTKIIGSMLGFTGIVLVNVTGNNLDMNMSLMGEGFVLLAALSSAFSSAFIKEFSKDSDVVMLCGYQFFCGGICMAIVGALAGGKLVYSGPECILLILYMGFISAAAYTLWSLLLKYNDVSKVSTCKFMNPIFGVLLSFIILKEHNALGWQVLAALILVTLGIYIVNQKKEDVENGK
jgi:drug/metabolite transporter (DMT)-like permease